MTELDRYAGSEQLLIASDFDGTLCPLVDRPAAAALPQAMCATIRELMDSDRVTLAILSGRALDDLARKVPFHAILGGNHGFEIRGPGIEFRHPEPLRLRSELAEARDSLGAAVAPWSGAWVEDKGLTVTVHYRQVHPCAQRAVVLAARRCMAKYGLKFGMRAGKKALEIYPRCEWNKGEALSWIRRELALTEVPCITVGDDRTDEWMFGANPDGVNIHVGSGAASTCANYFVADHVELMVVLARLRGTTARAPAPQVFAAGQPKVLVSSGD